MRRSKAKVFLIKTVTLLLLFVPITQSLFSAYMYYTLSPGWEAIWLTWNGDPARSIVINWRWNIASYAYVLYWNSTYRGIVNISVEKLNHVLISGLSPSTTYRYVIGYYEQGEMVNWSSVHTFHTPPARGAIRAIILSDTHAPGYGMFDRVLRAVSSESREDFIVHCGDMVDRSFPQFWASFFTGFSEILSELPIMPSIGNHEIHYGDPTLFYRFFELPNNEKWYFYRVGNALFISLYVADTHNFTFPREEYEMLIEAMNLAKEKNLWTIVYFHVPPIRVMPIVRYPEIANKLREVFTTIKPDLILTGHYHVYARTEFLGSKLVLMGASGGFPNQVIFKDIFKKYSFKPGYGILEVEEDRLCFKYVSIDGKIIDEFEILRT